MSEEKVMSPCPKPLTNFDQIFDSIRHYGRYQFFMLLCIQYIMLNSAGNYIFISFATLHPTCSIPLFVRGGGRVYLPPLPHLPHHMQTLQAVGSAVGAIVGGHAADVFGRKWITYLGAVHMCAFGLMGAFSICWEMLAGAMFGMGLAYGALIDASMTLASETVGPKYRIVQTLAFQWSLALQIASLLAYLTGDWRRYILAINVLCTPVLVLMLLWRESPRWLIQKNRHKEACRELNAISKWNGCEKRFVPADLAHIQLSTINSGKEENEEGRSHNSMEKIYSIWDLFSTRKLAAYSLVMIFSALTVEMSVAVIIFDVQILAGSPFWNIAFYGLLRIWVPFFIVLMEVKNNWFGRRVLFISSQSATVICYTSVILLILLSNNNLQNESHPLAVLRTILSLVGGVVNSSIFFTIYKQYSIELYPTLMRAMAVGTFGVVERVGGALAPQLINMNTWGWQGSALTITTCVAVISLVTGYAILPETRGQQMPDVHRKGKMREVGSEKSVESET